MRVQGARAGVITRRGGCHRLAVLVLLACTAAAAWLLVLSASADARSVANPFSGQWATNLGGGTTGTVYFAVLSASDGASQIQAMHGNPCNPPTTYYHGYYTDTGNGGENGTMTACTTSATELAGRYENSNTMLTYPGGDLDITLNSSQDAFSGFYTADDPSFSGMQFPYSGTFQQDFQGDGCCTTTTTTTSTTTATTTTTAGGGSGFTLRPPRAFCTATTTGRSPVAHAASLTCEGRDYIDFDFVTDKGKLKAEARAYLRTVLRATVIVCGLGARDQSINNTEQRGLDSVLLVVVCPLLVDELGSALAAVKNDPPAHDYRRIGLAGTRPRASASASASARGASCPSTLDATACTALVTARTNYANALSAVANDQNALAQGANRFASAVAANDPAAAYLQGAAGKIFAGALAYHLHVEQAAGEALANLLTADHLDGRLSSKQVKSFRSKGTSKYLSGVALEPLISDGLAHNRTQARKLLTTQLGGTSSSLDLVSAISQPLPNSTARAHYLSITMSELDAVVNGVSAQGDLASSAAQTLTNDLSNAQSACGNPSQRVAAMNRFVSDVKMLASGGTENLLVIGAGPLQATDLTSSSCQ